MVSGRKNSIDKPRRGSDYGSNNDLSEKRVFFKKNKYKKVA